ncbi:MAG: M3 family oligoendopeptidase [Ignavibacteria bacterium]|nr:M3 family oligoendopeptidase [Ignavibacteria bacterium]
MKFSEFKYTRPDIEEVKNKLSSYISEFRNAMSSDIQINIIDQINEVRTEFLTMSKIANIRYTMDTTDKFYEKEQTYFDRSSPVYSELMHEYYSSLINSKFRNELESKFGKHLFDIATVTVKTMSPEIIDDLITENNLCTEYRKLLASAKIMFDGEERNLAGLGPFTASTDREVRYAASTAKWKFFSDNGDEFDRIYDDLVKVRDRIARKLGFKNFVELGYARMNRTDYNSKDVSEFRKLIKDYVVPIARKLKDKQRQRLGLEELKYYDEGLLFKSGNASPKGSEKWIIEQTKRMYEELSPITKEFFNFMTENELMDLHNRSGKAAGGYCSFLKKYKSPFIFANFNGTEDDIRVLTHEAGHAFQLYKSKDFEVPEYISPTLEACEIHSMSMEFLTWPWMKQIFDGDVDKFKYFHLNRSIYFLPYSVTVDEFQHYIYENPDMTPAARKQYWRVLENKYIPCKDYDDNHFLQKGGYWQMQRHIYERPFYYIDYCLAEICAYQFWQKSLDDRDEALKDYINLCEAGGSKSFLELVKLAKIKSPFEESTLKNLLPIIENFLNDFDEAKLN